MSPATPYLDSLLAAQKYPITSPSAEHVDSTTPGALSIQALKPQTRIQPHREGAAGALPIETPESTSLALLPAPRVSEQVATPPVPTTPAATDRGLVTAPASTTTTDSCSPSAWPRKIGTLQLNCRHTATVWLLSPDRAVLTSACNSSSSITVHIETTVHGNARVPSSYRGEPGWTLTYCHRCCKYFLIRQ